MFTLWSMEELRFLQLYFRHWRKMPNFNQLKLNAAGCVGLAISQSCSFAKQTCSFLKIQLPYCLHDEAYLIELRDRFAVL